MGFEIVELSSEEELGESFQVMSQLRPHLSKEEYIDLLEEMIPDGYRLFALRESGKMTAVAGVSVGTNLYHGRHVWVYDLVTLEAARSKGYGKKLLEYIENFARKENCSIIALASNLERTEAHKFYQNKMGYEKKGFVFQKVL
ncbi:MAG: GNAT family N-acetyltransferase [Candidatus Omnitrophica bacterium]|nr:GNAT family N-acetyltransferase [Candidatus Omnitrophota bacterium]